MLCYVMLCYVILCHLMLFYVMLCYDILSADRRMNRGRDVKGREEGREGGKNKRRETLGCEKATDRSRKDGDSIFSLQTFKWLPFDESSHTCTTHVHIPTHVNVYKYTHIQIFTCSKTNK